MKIPPFFCCYRLTFGPQAEQHKSFDTWHKAYHGTSPGLVRRILDHGGLLLPGKSETLDTSDMHGIIWDEPSLNPQCDQYCCATDFEL